MSAIFSYLAAGINPFAQERRRGELQAYLQRLTPRPIREVLVPYGAKTFKMEIRGDGGALLYQMESDQFAAGSIVVIVELPEY